jgi:hypothetical protein
MAESVNVIDVGFVPEAAVSGAVLLQSEYSTYLIFNAIKLDADTGRYEDVGLAVCEFVDCMITKFGYPNEEAWHSIPRTKGLSYDVCEVANSEWSREIATLNRHAFPDTPELNQRHFLIMFHDSSFECLANELRAELTTEPLTTILARLSERIAAE